MYKLMLLSCVIMPSNAETERAFSVQNRIKSKPRTRLVINKLDQLIRISYNKIAIKDFPFNKALNIYILQPHRWF